MAKHIATGTPTQLAHPGKATLRTTVAVIVAALIAVVGFGPLIIDAIIQEPIVPETLRGALLAVSAVLVGLGAIFTRLMAIPGINDLLKKIGFGTGVEKESASEVVHEDIASLDVGKLRYDCPVPDAHEATADSALTMAGSKSVVYYSTSAPSGTATAGDIWRRIDASKNVIAEWFWDTAWRASQITNEMISNLDVGKHEASDYPVPDAHEPTTADTERYEQ